MFSLQKNNQLGITNETMRLAGKMWKDVRKIEKVNSVESPPMVPCDNDHVQPVHPKLEENAPQHDDLGSGTGQAVAVKRSLASPLQSMKLRPT